MGQQSNIEWCDATWSPVTGCTPISPGCANCYAKTLAGRFPKVHCRCNELYGGHKLSREHPFGAVHIHPERLEIPLHWKKFRKIFVCSMGDLFHDDVPDEFIGEVSRVTVACYRHTFMILTKRPERMRKWVNKWKPSGVYGFLDNVWLGVTAENQEQADKRIPILLQIPAAVKFVSVEPMLEDVFIEPYLLSSYEKASHDPQMFGDECRTNKLDWVICGAETGSKARPMQLSWALNLKTQCRAWNTPFFFKKAGNKIETPNNLNIKEFPKEK